MFECCLVIKLTAINLFVFIAYTDPQVQLLYTYSSGVGRINLFTRTPSSIFQLPNEVGGSIGVFDYNDRTQVS